MERFGCAALLGLALLFASDPAVGQSTELDRVERLVSEGRFGSARAELQAWLDTRAEPVPRIDEQRALWLRGLLTVDPDMAEMDFLRLAIEHAGGPFSDGALLRLAHVTRSRGQIDRARRHLETLLRDYPESALRDEARVLMESLSGTPGVAAMPSGSDGSSPAGAATSNPSVAPTDPPPNDPPPAPAAPPPAPDLPAAPGLPTTADAATQAFDGRPFTVQLGAFSEEGRAYTLAAAAEAAGVQVRIVRVVGSDLVHIRTGAFADETDAEVHARELRLRGLPASVSSDRPDEQAIP